MTTVTVDVEVDLEQVDDDELVWELQDRGYGVYRYHGNLPDAGSLRMVALTGTEQDLRNIVATLCDSTHLLPPTG